MNIYMYLKKGADADPGFKKEELSASCSAMCYIVLIKISLNMQY